MLERINLTSLGITVSVETKNPFILEFIKREAPSRVPDVTFSSGNLFNDYLITVKADSKNAFIKNDRKCLISGNYESDLLAMDSLMVAMKVFEDLYANGGMYSLHSSAVSNGREVVVLAGFASTGKTTTAINACLKGKDDLMFYSGDRTVLKGNNAMAGTKKDNVRFGSILYEIPELAKRIDCQETLDPWDRTVLADPEMMGILSDTGPREIKCFVYPKKVPGKLKVQVLNEGKSLIRLHDGISYFSDYFPHMVYGQREPLQSRLTDDQRKKRLDYVDGLTKTTPLLSISGNLDEMSEYVARILLRGFDG